MGFIKAEAPPPFFSAAAGQPSSGSHVDPFAFLPFAPPPMDDLQPHELCKSGLGQDSRPKVARACTECKARKMRCDGGLPFCGRCITHSRTKSCAYVDPPKRSPITRQYVSSLESQLEEANKKIAEFEARVQAQSKPNKSVTGPVPSSSKPTNLKVEGFVSTSLSSASTAVEAAPATSLRNRAHTIGQELDSTLDRANLTSKKRSKTHGGSEPDALYDSSALKGLDGSTRYSAAPLSTPPGFTSLRHVYPPSKSLVERPDDALGPGNFIGLSTGTAVLRVISQLCKAAQAGSNAPGSREHDKRSTGDDDELDQHGDSPELTCESLVRVDHTAMDANVGAFERYSAHLLPSDANVSAWDDANKQAVSELLNAYFEFHHPAYPILHSPTFRAQLMGELPPPNARTWPMLLNMVFALGSFESRVSTDEPELDLHYYGLARKAYSGAIFSEPNVVTVQALALMANYCQKRNFYSTSWMVLGSAIRMAVSLDLHLESPPSAKPRTALRKELDRRLWWTLYSMEADMCMSFGRPNTLAGIPADLALPRNLDDDNVTLSDKELPQEVKGATKYSTLICHAKFASDISIPIQARLMRAPSPAIEEIRAFDLIVQEYLDRLPEHMQEAELEQAPAWFTQSATRLRWRCNNLRMVMFRPFLLSAALSASAARQRGEARPAQRPAIKQAIALCRQLAKDNIDSVAQFWDAHNHNQAASWHAAYFITQSAFIPMVSILDDPHSPDAAEWIAMLNTCKALLEDMGTITLAALKCRDLVQSVTAGLVDEDAVDSRRARGNGWLQSPGNAATIEPILWAQPYAASATSDGSDISEVRGPSSLAFSLGSINSDGLPMFGLDSQTVQTSLEHRPSLAETIDAWASVRPTTASQWSDVGSHSSMGGEARPVDIATTKVTVPHQPGNGGATASTSRQRHSSSAASMTNSWTFGFHLDDQSNHQEPAAVVDDSLFSPFATRSLVSDHQPAQAHVGGAVISNIAPSDLFGEPHWRHAPAETGQAEHHSAQSNDEGVPNTWWSNLTDFGNEHSHHPGHGDGHQQRHHHQHHGEPSASMGPSLSASHGHLASHRTGDTDGFHRSHAQQHQHEGHFFDHSAFSGF